MLSWIRLRVAIAYVYWETASLLRVNGTAEVNVHCGGLGFGLREEAGCVCHSVRVLRMVCRTCLLMPCP
jgi:hypothetical protein